MRNLWRVATFDVAAPIAAIVALLAVGVVLGWPLWWVSACSVLVVLIVEAVAVNVVGLRRDSVTLGTDDDGPRLRVAAAAVATVALVAAVAVGFVRWTQTDRDFEHDSTRAVAVAVAMAEATATFDPRKPDDARKTAAALMVPERAAEFENEIAKSTKPLARDDAGAQATTLSGGIEALGPSVASVAVVLRVAQERAEQPPDRAVVALRVGLAKRDDTWLVVDVAPVHRR